MSILKAIPRTSIFSAALLPMFALTMASQVFGVETDSAATQLLPPRATTPSDASVFSDSMMLPADAAAAPGDSVMVVRVRKKPVPKKPEEPKKALEPGKSEEVVNAAPAVKPAEKPAEKKEAKEDGPKYVRDKYRDTQASSFMGVEYQKSRVKFGEGSSNRGGSGPTPGLKMHFSDFIKSKGSAQDMKDFKVLDGIFAYEFDEYVGGWMSEKEREILDNRGDKTGETVTVGDYRVNATSDNRMGGGVALNYDDGVHAVAPYALMNVSAHGRTNLDAKFLGYSLNAGPEFGLAFYRRKKGFTGSSARVAFRRDFALLSQDFDRGNQSDFMTKSEQWKTSVSNGTATLNWLNGETTTGEVKTKFNELDMNLRYKRALIGGRYRKELIDPMGRPDQYSREINEFGAYLAVPFNAEFGTSKVESAK